MGGSSWSGSVYSSVSSSRKAAGTTFLYNDVTMASTPYHDRKVHDEMNPFGVTRESRDSDAHPDSKAIAVLFDVTGSMGSIPRTLQEKLGTLMSLLIEKGYVEHPQILFGGIGDAYCDRAPLQIGQFESGLEMNDDLAKLYLEGGGGGQKSETYELGLYFMAKHTSIDCWEKRGEKGFIFTIGDEMAYRNIPKNLVKSLMDDDMGQDLSVFDVVKELQERYHVFHIIPDVPGMSSHYGDREVKDSWVELLGQNILMLDDIEAISETIALTIGLTEGMVDMVDGIAHMKEMGATDRIANSTSKAVSTVIATDRVATVDGSLTSVEREAVLTSL